MKKISLILIVLSVFVFTTACETYDDYDTDRPVIAGFKLTNTNHKINGGVGSSKEKKVAIKVSDAASVDRTIVIEVVQDLTTVPSENYSFDPNVVIPANETEVDLIVTGIDVSLTEEKRPLALKIAATNGFVSGGVIAVNIYN